MLLEKLFNPKEIYTSREFTKITKRNILDEILKTERIIIEGILYEVKEKEDTDCDYCLLGEDKHKDLADTCTFTYLLDSNQNFVGLCTLIGSYNIKVINEKKEILKAKTDDNILKLRIVSFKKKVGV